MSNRYNSKKNTYFNASEADSDSSIEYKELSKQDEPVSRGRQLRDESKFNAKDNFYVYDAVSSQLGLTEYQEQEGKRLLDQVNINNTGYSIEECSFAICALVTQADSKAERSERSELYWQYRTSSENRFDELLRELNLSQGRIDSAIDQMLDQLGVASVDNL